MNKSTDILRKKLQLLLDAKGMTKTELAKRSGLTRSGLDKYIKGISSPTLVALDKMASALHLYSWQLIHLEDKAFNYPLVEKLSKLDIQKQERLRVVLDTLISLPVEQFSFDLLEKFSKLSSVKQEQITRQVEGLIHLITEFDRDNGKKRA